MVGTVETYIAKRGFGFVRGQDGKKRFFHVNDFERTDATPSPRENLAVDFEPTETQRGLAAVKVRAIP